MHEARLRRLCSTFMNLVTLVIKKKIISHHASTDVHFCLNFGHLSRPLTRFGGWNGRVAVGDGGCVPNP